MEKRRVLIMAAATAGLVATAACAESVPDTVPDTLGDTVTTVPGAGPTTTADQPEPTDAETDIPALVAQLQTELTVLGEEIANSEAADTLQAAWEDLETRLMATIESVGTDGTIDMTELEGDLEEFQSTLDSLGDDVEAELLEAWTNFRSTLDQLAG
jgi:hypothetical protein